MTTWVQYLGDDENYELGYITKEVANRIGRKYAKTECIIDLVKLALKEKETVITRIVKQKEVSVNK